MIHPNLVLRVSEVFRLILDSPDLQIVGHECIGDPPEWDSFAHVNLIIALESEFGVEFTAEEISRLHSLESIMAALEIRQDEILHT